MVSLFSLSFYGKLHARSLPSLILPIVQSSGKGFHCSTESNSKVLITGMFACINVCISENLHTFFPPSKIGKIASCHYYIRDYLNKRFWRRSGNSPHYIAICLTFTIRHILKQLCKMLERNPLKHTLVWFTSQFCDAFIPMWDSLELFLKSRVGSPIYSHCLHLPIV